MTDAERNESARLGAKYGLTIALIAAIPFQIAICFSFIILWTEMSPILLLPTWIASTYFMIPYAKEVGEHQQKAREFLCATEWARSQDFQPDKLRLFSWTSSNVVLLVTLFSVLACCVLLPVGCIWLKRIVTQADKQRLAVHWVTNVGGRVVYDYETGDPTQIEPPGPEWLRDRFGIDCFANVVEVHIRNTQVSDVARLTDLPHLEDVYLSSTKVVDATPLSELISLERLDLSFTEVTDVTPLAKCRRLHYLGIERTKVSQENCERLKKSLPKLYIHGP